MGNLEQQRLQAVWPSPEHCHGNARMQRFALVPWRQLIRRFLHAVMHEAQAALARQQEARGNQDLHRSAWRPPQHPLQYAIVAAAACGAGDAQYVALWRR